MTRIVQQHMVLYAAVLTVGMGVIYADNPAYIGIDEVQTGQEGYCLSVWSGTAIEKFPLRVLSVVRNQRPGSDMILVRVNDKRFETSGAIHGCSGSPVFLDGRLAGALAAGWDGSLEPLYLVRPIKDMLEVGTSDQPSAAPLSLPKLTGDSVNLMEMVDFCRNAISSSAPLLTERLPLATSLPESVCRSLAAGFERMGFCPLPSGISAMAADEAGDVLIEPGSVLAAVMCGGDIQLAAVGTTTAVVGETVFGFGHSFTGNGPVEFPMAAGKVHAVIAGHSNSFKLSSPGKVLGTIQFDQNSAIRGRLGVQPRVIPLRIVVERFNDPQTRTYNCTIAHDRVYTPMITQLVTAATAQMQGPLPAEHTVRYKGQITVAEGAPIRIENVSSGRDLSDIATEIFATLTILMNNPFAEISPTGIEMQMTIEPSNTTATVWSATVSQTLVNPGQTLTAEVTFESFRSAKTRQSVSLTVPNNLTPGKYQLQLMGADQYATFLRQNAPQRFRVADVPSLLEGLRNLMDAPRNRLYAVLAVPATGLTLRRHTLPDLPPSRMNLLQDAKRAQPIEPYKNWVESSVTGDKIIDGTVQIELTVEQP